MNSDPNCIFCHLRQAIEDDVTELATLNKRLVIDQGSRNPYTASEYENRFRDWLRGDEWSVDIFADSEGVTLGYAVHTVQQDYYYPDQEVVYLRQFYIDRPMRRRGIGTAAYELLAKERFGDREVAVDVLATNPDGQKFWAHIGFTPYFTSMKKC